MKILTLITLLSIVTIKSFAQNVGIGLTTPLSKLHVKGTIRSDSLLLTHPGANDAILSLKTNEVISIAENLHVLYTIPVDGSLWQSFTAESTDTLQYISFYSNGPCLSNTVSIYEGTGTGGTLLSSVACTSGSGWIQTTELNLPVTAGQEYTFALANANHITFSADTYDGGGFNFQNTDFPEFSITFAVYKVSGESQPLLVKGLADSITDIAHPFAGANLELNGAITVNHVRIKGGGAGDGNILTSDANGFTRWTAANWKDQNGNICLADLEKNVGIGTDSPGAKLHIAGPQANLTIGDDFSPGPFNLMTVLGDGIVRFQNSAGDLRFMIDDDGLVSIAGGPAFDSKLSVHGTLWTEGLRMQNGAQDGYVLTSDFAGNAHWMPNNASSAWTQNGNDIYNNQSGNVGIGTDVPSVKLDVIGDGKFSNNVTVSGNMGIGTTTPDTRLHVIGDGKFSNNVTAGGNIGIGTTTPFYPLHIFNTQGSPLAEFEGQGYNFSIIEIKDLQKIMALGINAGTGILSLNDNTPFELIVDGSTKLHVSTNGNVGIGNFNPTDRLHVTGKTRTDQLQVVTGASSGYLLSSDANGNATWISKDAAGYWTKNVNDISSNVTGNIGLGISSPLAKLHILKNTASQSANDFLLFENTAAGGAGIKFKNPAVPTSLWQAYLESDGKFKIGRDGIGDFVTVLTDGKVGISNSTPIATLDVNGSIKTKYSGSIVTSDFVSTGLQTKTLTIPSLPAGYDLTNTVVLVTNSDGSAVFTIHQSKLTSLTSIDVKCTVISTGTVRMNWVVFKL